MVLTEKRWGGPSRSNRLVCKNTIKKVYSFTCVQLSEIVYAVPGCYTWQHRDVLDVYAKQSLDHPSVTHEPPPSLYLEGFIGEKQKGPVGWTLEECKFILWFSQNFLQKFLTCPVIRITHRRSLTTQVPSYPNCYTSYCKSQTPRQGPLPLTTVMSKVGWRGWRSGRFFRRKG